MREENQLLPLHEHPLPKHHEVRVRLNLPFVAGEMTSYDEDYDEEMDEGMDDADEAAGVYQ